MPSDAASSILPLNGRNSAAPRIYIPVLLFVFCLAAQLYLVFFKSFNWDEFLHFSQVYQLKAGTLSQPFQVLHARLLWWAPYVSSNLLDQMRAARLFMWGMELLTLFAIYGIARTFTAPLNAGFAAFAYLTAGYVFLHGFSVRADPMVTATLMFALFLLARGSLGLVKAIVIGALIGLAGMMTVKAVFYAPCFAGLLYLKFNEAREKRRFVGEVAALVIAAIISFGAVYLYHISGLARAAGASSKAAHLSFYLRWLTFDLPFANYVAAEVILAPLFFLGLMLAPLGWSRSGLKADAKIVLAGFIAPLAVLLFYRNTFPYFFVFILAPAAVAIAPVLGVVRDRYGSAFLSILLSIMPLASAMIEPRDVIRRQQALIDYVHREYPRKTGYLDHSAMIADYPRVLRFLTSGNGINTYYEAGDPVVCREIDRGNLPFIIANSPVIAAALEGRPVPRTFLPADLEAMRGNYVRQWGLLWREGVQVPAGTNAFDFRLRRGGAFVLAGDRLTIDGVNVTHGAAIRLGAGRHLIGGKRIAPTVLWRGNRLPGTPPSLRVDSVFTNY